MTSLFETLAPVFEARQTFVRVSPEKKRYSFEYGACGFDLSKIYSKEMFEEAKVLRILSREEPLMTAIANVTQFSHRIGAARAEAGVASVSGAQVSTKLRLTRRGRLVFGGLATVLIAGALGFAASFAAPGAIANGAEGVQGFPYVIAQSGDSLWSIATDLEPAADPRDVVAEIQRLNQMQASELQAGEAVAVPLRFEGNDLTFQASGL